MAATADDSVADGFAALYVRHRDAVLKYCYHRLGDWDEAADATQQAFANAFAAFARFEDRGDAGRAWLFTIASHEIAKRGQGRCREGAALGAAADVPDPAPSPEESAVTSDEHERLRRLLDTLPPTPRRVCELRLAGLSTADIARQLDTTQGAVRTAHSRAVAQLARVMQLPLSEAGIRRD